MAGIGIIVNPNAHGLVRDTALPDRLRAILGDDGEVVSTRNPDELRNAVARFRGLGVDVLGMCGGDGTNLYALTEMIRHFDGVDLPAVAILRGGTVNTTANCLRISGTPDEILTRLLAKRRAGQPYTFPWPLLQVNELFGFLFGSGLAGRFFEAYYAGSLVGLPMAAWLTARALFSTFTKGPLARKLFEPMEGELTIDDGAFVSGRFTLLLASTIAEVGLGVKIAHRARGLPDLFHLLASQLSPEQLARQFPRTFFGRAIEGQGHTDRLARKVEIRLGRPQPYLIDGDLFRGDRVTLCAGPEIRIARP